MWVGINTCASKQILNGLLITLTTIHLNHDMPLDCDNQIMTGVEDELRNEKPNCTTEDNLFIYIQLGFGIVYTPCTWLTQLSYCLSLSLLQTKVLPPAIHFVCVCVFGVVGVGGERGGL